MGSSNSKPSHKRSKTTLRRETNKLASETCRPVTLICTDAESLRRLGIPVETDSRFIYQPLQNRGLELDCHRYTNTSAPVRSNNNNLQTQLPQRLSDVEGFTRDSQKSDKCNSNSYESSVGYVSAASSAASVSCFSSSHSANSTNCVCSPKGSSKESKLSLIDGTQKQSIVAKCDNKRNKGWIASKDMNDNYVSNHSCTGHAIISHSASSAEPHEVSNRIFYPMNDKSSQLYAPQSSEFKDFIQEEELAPNETKLTIQKEQLSNEVSHPQKERNVEVSDEHQKLRKAADEAFVGHLTREVPNDGLLKERDALVLRRARFRPDRHSAADIPSPRDYYGGNQRRMWRQRSDVH